MPAPKLSGSKLEEKDPFAETRPQPEPRGGEQRTMDRVKALLESFNPAPASRPKAEPEVSHDSVPTMEQAPRDDPIFLDKLKGLVSAGEKAPSEDPKFLEKVKGMVSAGEKAASRLEAEGLRDDANFLEKVKGLVSAGDQGVSAKDRELQDSVKEQKLIAKENQRVANFINGVCSQTPDQAYMETIKDPEMDNALRQRRKEEEEGELKIHWDKVKEPKSEKRCRQVKEMEAKSEELKLKWNKAKESKSGPKEKKVKEMEVKRQDPKLEETRRQLREMEEKREELRRVTLALEQAKEKQAQVNHYVRGWIQREAEKQPNLNDEMD